MARSRLGLVVDGTTYDDRAKPAVMQILESARKSGRPICYRYGDRETGRDWGDMRMCGRIGRSMGPEKIPLRLASRRSMGGEGLLEAFIVKIHDPASGRLLYRHPRYHGAPPPHPRRR